MRAGLERAGHEPLEVEIAREGRWTTAARRSTLEPGAAASRRRRRLPGAARPLRRGRHGPGPARGARRAIRGRRRDGLRRLHGQGRVQGADGPGRRAAGGLRGAARGRRSAPRSAASASRCSSSPRGSDRRWDLEGLRGRRSWRRRSRRRSRTTRSYRRGDGPRPRGRVLGDRQREPEASVRGRSSIDADWYDYEAKYPPGGMGCRAGADPGRRRASRSARWPSRSSARRLRGHGARATSSSRTRRASTRARQRAQHDPRLHETSVFAKLFEASGVALPRAARPAGRAGARAPRRERRYSN